MLSLSTNHNHVQVAIFSLEVSYSRQCFLATVDGRRGCGMPNLAPDIAKMT